MPRPLAVVITAAGKQDRRCSLATFRRENASDPDLLDQLDACPVGEPLRIGGGAVPLVTVTKVGR